MVPAWLTGRPATYGPQRLTLNWLCRFFCCSSGSCNRRRMPERSNCGGTASGLVFQESHDGFHRLPQIRRLPGPAALAARKRVNQAPGVRRATLRRRRAGAGRGRVSFLLTSPAFGAGPPFAGRFPGRARAGSPARAQRRRPPPCGRQGRRRTAPRPVAMPGPAPGPGRQLVSAFLQPVAGLDHGGGGGGWVARAAPGPPGVGLGRRCCSGCFDFVVCF